MYFLYHLQNIIGTKAAGFIFGAYLLIRFGIKGGRKELTRLNRKLDWVEKGGTYDNHL
jgi:hypothetical protein